MMTKGGQNSQKIDDVFYERALISRMDWKSLTLVLFLYYVKKYTTSKNSFTTCLCMEQNYKQCGRGQGRAKILVWWGRFSLGPWHCSALTEPIFNQIVLRDKPSNKNFHFLLFTIKARIFVWEFVTMLQLIGNFRKLAQLV